ncbi:unnamed protein product [Alopecurus aequalis]
MPQEYELLEDFYEAEHRGRRLADREKLFPLRIRCHSATHPDMKYDERYTPYLRRAGLLPFITMVRRGIPTFNASALTALVDRWRPETHSFHLPCGEMTITLQDVAMILGLPIVGHPVTGNVDSAGWRERVEEYLGALPDGGKTNGVSFVWLRHQFGEPPTAAADDLTVERAARAYVLYVLGSTLFPDGTGDSASWMWLPLFSDWDQAGQYSWGSAALAFLYRQLCEACRRVNPGSNLGGCVLLVQVWMWERLPVGRPSSARNPWVFDEQDRRPTVAHLWERVSEKNGKAEILYEYYTREMDLLQPSTVRWSPYTRDEVNSLELNHICKRDDLLWKAICPMICFYVVEYHLPHRVMRQFGLLQPLPPQPIDTLVELHRLDRKKNKTITDWSKHHKRYIDKWNLAVDTSEPHLHKDKRFRDYLEWLHGATRMRLKTACTHDDILVERRLDKDNEFDNEKRADFQIEHAPIADQVAMELMLTINEAGVVLRTTKGAPDAEDTFRAFIEKTTERLRGAAARLVCHNTSYDVVPPLQQSRGTTTSGGASIGGSSHGGVRRNEPATMSDEEVVHQEEMLDAPSSSQPTQASKGKAQKRKK